MHPEAQAHEVIDTVPRLGGRAVQDRDRVDLGGALGVAVPVSDQAARYDGCRLLVGPEAVHVIEAKPAGPALSGPADPSAEHLAGLADTASPVRVPLPSAYGSTGTGTYLHNERAPGTRSRRGSASHEPKAHPAWTQDSGSLHGRLRALPPLDL